MDQIFVSPQLFFMCLQLLLISSFYYQSFPSPSELPLTFFLGTLIDSKIVFFKILHVLHSLR